MALSEAEELELLELELLESQSLGGDIGPLTDITQTTPETQIPEGNVDVNKIDPVDLGLGLGETALTIGTGMVNMAAAGYVGAAVATKNEIENFFSGDDKESRASEVINQLNGQFTYQPRTETGNAILGGVGKVGGVMQEAVENAGQRSFQSSVELGIPPESAAVIGTVAEVGPQMLPFGVPKALQTSKISQAKKDINAVEKEARGQNIDLNKPIEQQLPQTREAALKQGGTSSERGRFDLPARGRGENAQVVVGKLVEMKQSLKQAEDAAWDKLRSTDIENSTIPFEPVAEVRNLANNYLEGFALGKAEQLPLGGKRHGGTRDPMKPIKGALADMDDTLVQAAKLKDKNIHARIKIKALVQFRKELVKQQASPDPEVAGAATAIKKASDEVLLNDYMTTLIKGDADAIKAWKDAIESSKELKSTFNDIDIVKKLVAKEATPEEIVSMIFGASKGGFKVETGKNIQQLKKVLGEDSDAFAALRQEAALRIVDDLVKPDIGVDDIQRFVKKFEETIKSNPTVVKELFPDSSNSLYRLAALAKAQANSAVTSVGAVKLTRAASQFLFGHDIARKALIVRTGETAFEILRKQLGINEKRAFMAEVLGYDAFASPFTAKSLALGGTLPTVNTQIQQDLGVTQ